MNRMLIYSSVSGVKSHCFASRLQYLCLLTRHIWLQHSLLLWPELPSCFDTCSLGQTCLFFVERHLDVKLVGCGLSTQTQAISSGSLGAMSCSLRNGFTHQISHLTCGSLVESSPMIKTESYSGRKEKSGLYTLGAFLKSSLSRQAEWLFKYTLLRKKKKPTYFQLYFK